MPRLARGARFVMIARTMPLALRFPLVLVLLAACAGCQTHDRRIYSTRRDKNLHAPSPWAPSTTKAADEATSSAVGAPLEPANSANPVEPGTPPTSMPPP